MDINSTAMIEIGIVTAILMSPLIYYWAKRKTTDPVVTTIYGIFMMFFPILNLIYLLFLFKKPDLKLNPEK